MHGKVYFSESTSTKHLTDSVEVKGSFWSILSLLEWLWNFSHNICNFLRPWTQLSVLWIFLSIISLNQLLGPQHFSIKSLLIDIRCHLSDFLLLFLCNHRSLRIIRGNMNIIFIKLLEFYLILEFEFGVLKHLVVFLFAWRSLNVFKDVLTLFLYLLLLGYLLRHLSRGGVLDELWIYLRDLMILIDVYVHSSCWIWVPVLRFRLCLYLVGVEILRGVLRSLL